MFGYADSLWCSFRLENCIQFSFVCIFQVIYEKYLNLVPLFPILPFLWKWNGIFPEWVLWLCGVVNVFQFNWIENRVSLELIGVALNFLRTCFLYFMCVGLYKFSVVMWRIQIVFTLDLLRIFESNFVA